MSPISGILSTAFGGTGIAYFTAAGPTQAQEAADVARQQKIELMSQAQIDMEIGLLLRKKIKEQEAQEQELFLFMMIAAAAA